MSTLSRVCRVCCLSFQVFVCLGSVIVPNIGIICNFFEEYAVKIVCLKLKMLLPYYIFPRPFWARGRGHPFLVGAGAYLKFQGPSPLDRGNLFWKQNLNIPVKFNTN